MADAGICQFCNVNKDNYKCPKCSAKYCSLDCYKHESHLNCTEIFYKNWIDCELKTRSFSDRNKMEKILANNKHEILKLTEENSLEERLKDVNLDDDLSIWTKLSSAEQTEYLELLKQDKMDQILPIWSPWWLIKEPLITETKQIITLPHPKILENIPQIDINAAFNVKFNIINVLTTYVLCAKYYNGDHHSLAHEAARNILELSTNLKHNENFNHVETAIFSPLEMGTKFNLTSFDASTLLNTIDDLINLLNGPKSTPTNIYSAAALSDLHELFKLSRKSMEFDRETKNLLMKSEKKILFYLNFLAKNDFNVLNELLEARKIHEKMSFNY